MSDSGKQQNDPQGQDPVVEEPQIKNPPVKEPSVEDPPVEHSPVEESSFEDAEPKYLVAEDNHVNQRLVTKLFEKFKRKHHKAWNGLEAVEMYKTHPEQCRMILMDISMPELSGLEAAKRIREHEKEHGFQPAIVVALSAHVMEKDNERYVKEYGMNTTLKKPISPGRLGELLKNWPVEGGATVKAEGDTKAEGDIKDEGDIRAEGDIKAEGDMKDKGDIKAEGDVKAEIAEV
ncbi:hypothetical protein F53441_13842 [Fusarium austroafricanum]|uniref:Response regulatory domain-containing protein n=1 Tax=Fusarium austroafricanum TaxID=2364996 RepID=A0A8H4JM89_9HYPO|nr:hypothetical protein F53441_13842 [Fusarium austroafricanum]